MLCYNGLNFLKVCMGKKGNRHFSLNFDIFAIKMTHLNVLLSFLLPSRFSAQSEAFFFFGIPLLRKRRGKPKSDSSLRKLWIEASPLSQERKTKKKKNKKLWIELRSEMTIEKTTRH